MADRIRLLAIALASLTGLIVTCSVFYPGVMSPDSVGAYRQAITGVIEGRTKTPLLAFLWMWIVTVIPGAFGMLLLHSAMFWSGLGLTVAACRLSVLGSVGWVLGIGLFPTVFALLGMIWSDVLLAVSLTLFVGLALTGATRGSSRWLALSLIPLWCGLSARVNALPAVLPLTVWFVALWSGVSGRDQLRRPRRLAAVSAGLLLILLVASKGFDRLIIDHGSGSYTRSLQFVFFHDLAGLAAATGDLRLPPHVYRNLPEMNLELIRSVYDPADVNLLIYNPKWDASAFLRTDRAGFLELLRLWAGAIAAHPGAYLSRRADAVMTMLQINGVHYPFHTGIDPNDYGLTFHRDPVYEGLTRWLFRYDWLLFRGWAFALLAVVVSIVGIRRRQWSAVAVCTSGLLYVAPIVVVTTGSDFRYIWWLVVCALIGTLLLAGDPATRTRVGASRSGRPDLVA